MAIAYNRPFSAVRFGLRPCFHMGSQLVAACFVMLLGGLAVRGQDETDPLDKPASERERVQLDKVDIDFKSVKDKTPLLTPLDNPAEFDAFNKVLMKASTQPLERLKRFSLRGLGYENLVGDEQRQFHLRELIQIKGDLKYPLTEIVAVPLPLKKFGIEKLYAAWVEVPGAPNQLVQVIFVDLPVELGMADRGRYKITVDGYYFKLLEYPDEEEIEGVVKQVKRLAPLLLTRTINAVEDKPAPVPTTPDEAKLVQLNKLDPLWQSVKDKKPLVGRDDNIDEYNAYNLVVKTAASFAPETLKKYARRDVIYADLLGEIRQQYLRELLNVKGTLVRLRKREITGRLKATTTLRDVYEGWIVNDRNDSQTDPQMIQVVFTELPEGLEPGEKLNHKVSFDGYYFKLHGYETKEKNEKGELIWRMAPLLIGRKIELLDPDPSYWEFANPAIPLMLGTLGVLAVGVLGLLIWFRLGDRNVHARAHGALTKKNPFDERGSTPSVEPGNEWNRLEH